jgi:hypothetical protein
MAGSAVEVDATTIASPCAVPWESMSGDDAKRSCGPCRLPVHDVSQRTCRGIRALVASTGGAVRKRTWRRPDGRVPTKGCGRLRGAVERRLRFLRTAAVSLLDFLGLGGCSRPCCERERPAPASAPPPSSSAGAPPPAAPAPVRGATVSTGR